MMKVGRDKLDETGKTLSYRTVKTDFDGWVDAKHYLPADYDLMYLKIKDKKSSHGWVVGTKWDGLKIEQGDQVLYWKKKNDQM